MKNKVLFYNKETEAILGGVELTDNQMKLLIQLEDSGYLSDSLLVIKLDDIDFERP